jgi:hypothetical protein
MTPTKVKEELERPVEIFSTKMRKQWKQVQKG